MNIQCEFKILVAMATDMFVQYRMSSSGKLISQEANHDQELLTGFLTEESNKIKLKSIHSYSSLIHLDQLIKHWKYGSSTWSGWMGQEVNSL